MFNVTGGELVIVSLVALMVLGPQRLPQAARTIGKVLAQIREVSAGFQQELKQAFDAGPDEPAPPIRPLLTALSGGAGADEPGPTSADTDVEEDHAQVNRGQDNPGHAEDNAPGSGDSADARTVGADGGPATVQPVLDGPDAAGGVRPGGLNTGPVEQDAGVVGTHVTETDIGVPIDDDRRAAP